MRGRLSSLVLAAALAVPSLAYAQGTSDGDPWEGLNRDLYGVHDSVDRAVLEPIARGYRAVTPRPVRTSVQNVLRNLRGPVIFANDLLQGEIGRAGVTAVRFGVNTTIGVVGIFDPAASMGLERHDEDFGQTLAVWGVDEGPYLFIPLMGPSNVRDTTGRVVDMVFDPLTWARGDDVQTWRAVRGVTTGVAAREQVIEAVETVRRDSVDPYTSIRTSYGLLRASAIENGQADVQDLPDFDDIPDVDQTPGVDASPASPDSGGPDIGANAQQNPVIDAKALSAAPGQPTSSSKAQAETGVKR